MLYSFNLVTGSCQQDSSNNVACIVGHTDSSLTLSEAINTITLECDIIQIMATHPLTYSWKLNGITVIQSGSFMPSFYNLRPELDILSRYIMQSNSSDLIKFLVSDQNDPFSQAETVSCFNHNITVSLKDMVHNIATGTWTCEVESSFGNISSGTVTVNEPGKKKKGYTGNSYT